MKRLLWTLPLFLLAWRPVEGGPARYALVVHGGAGADPAQMEPEEVRGVEDRLRQVLRQGLARLHEGRSSLEVVTEAVVTLEDDPWFNAGRGAALNAEGEAELDASIMEGEKLRCGAVAGVRRCKNPIRLARKVMESTPHVLLVGAGADRFAGAQGLELVDPEYFVTERARQALQRKRGTVGCVALDRSGHLAAATSTGGLTGKLPGRVGDSPVIGAGTYADDRTCAVSCTGTGEEFIRHQVAGRISHRMQLLQVSLPEAVQQTYADGMPEDVGGVISVDRRGQWYWYFNTPGMARGAADWRGEFQVAIGKDK